MNSPTNQTQNRQEQTQSQLYFSMASGTMTPEEFLSSMADFFEPSTPEDCQTPQTIYLVDSKGGYHRFKENK